MEALPAGRERRGAEAGAQAGDGGEQVGLVRRRVGQQRRRTPRRRTGPGRPETWRRAPRQACAASPQEAGRRRGGRSLSLNFLKWSRSIRIEAERPAARGEAVGLLVQAQVEGAAVEQAGQAVAVGEARQLGLALGVGGAVAQHHQQRVALRQRRGRRGARGTRGRRGGSRSRPGRCAAGRARAAAGPRRRRSS